jgi:hypothetical protein
VSGEFGAPTSDSSGDKKLKRLALTEAELGGSKRQRQDTTYPTGVKGTDANMAYWAETFHSFRRVNFGIGHFLACQIRIG